MPHQKSAYMNFLAKKYVFLYCFLIVAGSVTCSKKNIPVPPAIPPGSCFVGGVDTCALAASTRTANINLLSDKQTIHSFGASDCWSIKFVGKNWPVNKRNEIADLLFSKDLDANGNPKGIGLSLWRINVGAGSFEQGAASNISSEWRREECFQNAAGTYDWTKQAGNRWFAQAAKTRGVENLLLFSIAAPVHYSKNGLASGNPAANELGKINLMPDKFDEYADFMAEVAKFYTQAGMPINFISPVNETNWNWVLGANGQASQEGTSATNAEIFQLATELNNKIVARGLNTKIALCESGSHGYTNGAVSGVTNRSDFINYFWNPASSGYVGNLPTVEKIISSHSYGAQSNVSNLISNRTNLANRISGVNNSIKYWQSEYCILSNEDGTGGPGRDLGMNSALYIARVIHSDLALGNAASWQWWLGVSPSDYKDGLVSIADPAGAMGELPATKNDGIIYKSKMLWALGNYSRFVRPGMIRVDASLSGITDAAIAANSLMISAYKNPTTKELVVVVINMGTVDEKIKFGGINFTSGNLKTYTTDATKELQFGTIPAAGNLTIGARSIVTFVGNYQ
jgi:O-glycosyl hydrolase